MGDQLLVHIVLLTCTYHLETRDQLIVQIAELSRPVFALMAYPQHLAGFFLEVDQRCWHITNCNTSVAELAGAYFC